MPPIDTQRLLLRLISMRQLTKALHELLHCFQDVAGTAPTSKNNYHSAWFRETARRLGIPCTRYGASEGIVDPSPFMTWGQAEGLNRRVAAGGVTARSKPERHPKRVAWVCDCDIEMAVTVHVVRGSLLDARCERCLSQFRRK